MTRRTVVAALTKAHGRNPQARVDALMGVLRAKELRQPAPVQSAFAAIATAQVAVIATLNEQIDA